GVSCPGTLLMPIRPRTNWRVQGPLVLFLVVSLALAFLVFRYFLLTFAVGASVALLLSGVHGALARRLGGGKGLAAAPIVLAVMVVLLMPLVVYGVLIEQQAISFLDWLRPHLEPQDWDRFWRETLPTKSPQIAHWLQAAGWKAPPLQTGIARLTGAAQTYVQVVLAGAAAALLDLVIFLMMLFFLLRDGEEIRESLRGISPFTRGQESELIDHLASTVRASLLAMIAVPLIQGIVAFIGF